MSRRKNRTVLKGRSVGFSSVPNTQLAHPIGSLKIVKLPDGHPTFINCPDDAVALQGDTLYVRDSQAERVIKGMLSKPWRSP